MEFYSVSSDEQRKQITLPPEAEVFMFWKKGFGFPSTDGTLWGLPSDMACVMIKLQTTFPQGG